MLFRHKLALLIGLATASNVIYAYDYSPDKSGHWGADLGYMFAKPKNDWQKVFRKKETNFNVHVGYDFNNFAGLEAGYAWTTRQNYTTAINTGTAAFGTVDNVNTSVVTSKIRHRNYHLDLNLYSPSYYKVNLLAKLGAVYYRPNATVSTTPTGGNISNSIDPIKGHRQIVPKIGLGLNAMLNDQWGMRFLWQYDVISKTRFANIAAPYNKVFKNSNTFSLGIYRVFNFMKIW